MHDAIDYIQAPLSPDAYRERRRLLRFCAMGVMPAAQIVASAERICSDLDAQGMVSRIEQIMQVFEQLNTRMLPEQSLCLQALDELEALQSLTDSASSQS
jgi:hypothetical protein